MVRRVFMFKFYQEETCDAIIRHLEGREGQTRHDVHIRDVGNHTSPDARVEMTFRLGDQLYAIEHTGIEPFDGFMEHQNRAHELSKPIETAATAALANVLTPGSVVEIHMPVDAFKSRKLPEVRKMQGAIVDAVTRTAPTLPREKYGNFRGTLVAVQPTGVPFPISLVRFDGFGALPGRLQIRHATSAGEEPRELRIKRACEKKFPKLGVWKRDDNARTILVLEDNDIQLTNVTNVADAFLPVAKSRPDCPDETYMVATCMSPWYAWPILVNGSSYYEIAKGQDGGPIHFEIEPPKDPIAA
jgi:hypothetical protein